MRDPRKTVFMQKGAPMNSSFGTFDANGNRIDDYPPNSNEDRARLNAVVEHLKEKEQRDSKAAIDELREGVRAVNVAHLQRRIIELEAELNRLQAQQAPVPDRVVEMRSFIVPRVPEELSEIETIHNDVQSMITLIYSMLLNGATEFELKQRIMGLQ